MCIILFYAPLPSLAPLCIFPNLFVSQPPALPQIPQLTASFLHPITCWARGWFGTQALIALLLHRQERKLQLTQQIFPLQKNFLGLCPLLNHPFPQRERLIIFQSSIPNSFSSNWLNSSKIVWKKGLNADKYINLFFSFFFSLHKPANKTEEGWQHYRNILTYYWLTCSSRQLLKFSFLLFSLQEPHWRLGWSYGVRAIFSLIIYIYTQTHTNARTK